METNRNIAGHGAALDAQIARLLGHAEEAGSIVDRLMAMPGGEAGPTAAEWDRAVARRLERHLSTALRDLLEGETEKRSA